MDKEKIKALLEKVVRNYQCIVCGFYSGDNPKGTKHHSDCWIFKAIALLDDCQSQEPKCDNCKYQGSCDYPEIKGNGPCSAYTVKPESQALDKNVAEKEKCQVDHSTIDALEFAANCLTAELEAETTKYQLEKDANTILIQAKENVANENEKLRTDLRAETNRADKWDELYTKCNTGRIVAVERAEAAEKEIKTFADWRARLEQQARTDNTTVKYERERSEQLQADNKRLQEALFRYGGHEPCCMKGDVCNCGYSQALKGK